MHRAGAPPLPAPTWGPRSPCASLRSLLSAGTRLGRYEIVTPLGAGGMGEVYQARDMRLGRSVAIKVLRLDLAGDDGLRARFRREAESIAALKHPHVCVLYDVGEHEDLDFLVMEHCEGETLADRLRRGPMPLDDVIRCGIEIAEALAAAHRQSFVHRDLKPGNVMLTKTGAKVLDFGLAKPLAPPQALADSVAATRDQALTVEGTIVGTLGYMAPEVLEGRPADARSDLFALGAILWEMASGRRAFEASTQAGLIAAILTGEPGRTETSDAPLPPLLERAVRKSLVKDPDRRWQSATDLADALRWVSDGVAEGPAPAAAAPRSRRWGWLAAGALLACVALAAVLATRPDAARTSRPTPMRLSIVPPPGTVFSARDISGHAQFALSPDGTRIAFVAGPLGQPGQIWVRPLESGGGAPLPGTEDASGPFWSPDGESLAFFARGKLKRITLDGAVVRELAEVSADVGTGSWGSEGLILFSGGAGEGFIGVSADGGPARPATSLNLERKEVGHRAPQFLPDGRRFLLYVGSALAESSGAHLGSLDAAGTTQLLTSAANAVYAEPGYLLFDHASHLTAQRFDLEAEALVGEPISLGDRVIGMGGSSFLPVSASDNGILAYWDGRSPPTELRWFDRTGRPLGTVDAPGAVFNPRLSPDGRQLVFSERNPAGDSDLWRIDLESGLASRLTFSGVARFATWSPDGRSLVYSDRLRLFRRAASGAGDDVPIEGLAGHWAIFPEDWSRDGRWLVCIAAMKTGWELTAVDLTSGESRLVREAPGSQIYPSLSPDGRWVAYTSDESGRWEVYVQPFPVGAGRWQVSSAGGSQPVWRGDGRELYYLDGQGSVIAVPVRSTEVFEVGRAERLFTSSPRSILAPYRWTFAVTPDGDRFLIQVPLPNADPSTITVILDWLAALNRSTAETARR